MIILTSGDSKVLIDYTEDNFVNTDDIFDNVVKIGDINGTRRYIWHVVENFTSYC